VTAAIVGSRRPSQIKETILTGDIELEPEIMDQVAGLLEKREKALAEAATGGSPKGASHTASATDTWRVSMAGCGMNCSVASCF
jgi:hypothetical protein